MSFYSDFNIGGLSLGGSGASSGSSVSAYGFIAGQVLQIGSQIYGGMLQDKIYQSNARLAEAQGNYSSSVAEYNAAVARANATAIRSVADLDIERQKKAATRLKSAQIAGYAKSGVKLTGSPLEVMIDSAAQAKIDQAITDYNAKIGIMQTESQAKGYETTGQLARTEAATKASLSRIEGTFKKNQELLKGSTNLLTSAIDFYKMR